MTTSELAWATFFAGVVAMERHPGKTRDGKPLSIRQCAVLADLMLEELEQRRAKWDGQEQDSQRSQDSPETR